MRKIFHGSSIKKIFLFSAIIYFSGFILGILLVMFISGLNETALVTTNSPYLNAYKNMSSTSYILKNNLLFISLLVSGTISLGIITFLNLLCNGFIFGAQACSLVLAGCPVLTILLSTIPHGIFEIPGILCAGTAGFKIPYELLQYFTNKKDHMIDTGDLLDILLLTIIAIILIIVAAFVESTISYNIIKNIYTG
jgi:stage II sporulation protein M